MNIKKIECKIYKTLKTRNYYYKHMKKHPEAYNASLNTTGKKCTKYNVNKPLECFNNDKYKKDGKTSHCKDCRKNKIDDNEKIITQDVFEISQKFKKVLDLKNVECTACNKGISKTNWCKHEKRNKHIKNIEYKNIIFSTN